MKGNIFFSVDVETTGPCPNKGSMISLGCVPVLWDGTILQDPYHFYINLHEVYERDEDTMENFWAKFPEQWNLTKIDPFSPWEAISKFNGYIDDVMGDYGYKDDGTIGRGLFVAWPANFDWQFVNHYLRVFNDGENNPAPFGYSAFDLKSYIAGRINDPSILFSSRSDGSFPGEWEVESDEPHHALFDAWAQAESLANILRSSM